MGVVKYEVSARLQGGPPCNVVDQQVDQISKRIT